jgi:hypothetical protein
MIEIFNELPLRGLHNRIQARGPIATPEAVGNMLAFMLLDLQIQRPETDINIPPPTDE